MQLLLEDIGVFSAWREIRELESLGRDLETGLWIYGDCVFQDGGPVLFADDQDIVWHGGVGYRLDPDSLSGFAHKHAPRFFQQLGKQPQDVLSAILADPAKEELEVGKIFLQLCADMIATFGDASGLLILGCVLGYAAAPELLRKYHGHPGAWIHGRAFSGKTETASFLMQLWGFPPDYQTVMLSSGTTTVAVDKLLSQYCDTPLHLDEFRQKEADKARISALRSAYNRQAKSKSKMHRGSYDSNRVRAVPPLTSPIVTGEGVTNDSATLSRYVEAILSGDKRLGDKTAQRARYARMLADSKHYHRIIRWIMMRRKEFAAEVIGGLDAFLDDPEVTDRIQSDRIRLTYGAAYAAFKVVFDRLANTVTEAVKTTAACGSVAMTRSDLKLLSTTAADLRGFAIGYSRNASCEVASVNFVVKFWHDVVTAVERGKISRKFMECAWCAIDDNNHVMRLVGKNPAGFPCILVRASEIYAEYELDCRSRGAEPDLTLSNIRNESQAERYWVPSPESNKRRAHRLYFKEEGQRDVWVLRFDLMDDSLSQLFESWFDPRDQPAA